MVKRAAVVIGVDKTGGHQPLRAAAICAERVATWLDAEGYDTTLLDDRAGPVTLKQVKDAIKSYVTSPPSYHQLVVYFSGHGHLHASADVWLLSEAPTDPDAAINMDKAMFFARRSGIENIVFISDACRNIDPSVVGNAVSGSNGFPNHAGQAGDTNIDTFKATASGSVAWEGKIGGEYWSVLTYAWMGAYESTDPDMRRSVTENGVSFEVVPNRKLKAYLQSEVNKLLFQLKLFTKPQEVKINVPADDHIYIARARTPKPPPKPKGFGFGHGPPPAPGPMACSAGLPPSLTAMSVGIDAGATLSRDLSYRGFGRSGGADDLSVDLAETEEDVTARLPVPEVEAFESQCGFSVRGAKVVAAYIAGGEYTGVELLDWADHQNDGYNVVRVWDPEPPTTALLKFDDGRAALVAALPGYIGHVVVGTKGVSSIAYIPSAYSARFTDFAPVSSRLDRVRSLAALASDDTTLELNRPREAQTFIEDITYGTAIDPAMALYGAQALATSGQEAVIRDLADLMFQDIGAIALDLHVLSAAQTTQPIASHVPMLTRTWNLLDATGVAVPAPLAQAQNHLCNSLWTTLTAKGVGDVLPFFKKGF